MLDGQDTIVNFDTNQVDLDMLSFTDVAFNDLWFSQQGNNLVIDLVGTNDQVTVKNWYLGESSQLDTIKASDLLLQQGQVAQLVNAMAVFDVPAGVGAVVPQEVKDQLTTVLATSWQ